MDRNRSLSNSYLSVHYELRPAKQVERRMLIDAFQLVQQGGFKIREYLYFGMGSIYFVDYILLHKYLGIQHMVSVEASPKAKKRVLFNRPFGVVDVRHGMAGSYIPTLAASRRHIVWLDYDSMLNSDSLSDVRQTAQQLSSGSLLLVTFDSEALDRHNPSAAETEKYYRAHCGEFIPGDLASDAFSEENLPMTIMRITREIIEDGVRFRDGVDFAEVFFFEYADGRRMVTLGGMIVDGQDRARLQSSGLTDVVYSRLRWDDGPYRIRVPLLTKRERSLLDAAVPYDSNWKPDGFEIDEEDLAS